MLGQGSAFLAEGSLLGRTLLWGGVLLVLLIVLGAALLLVRRWLLAGKHSRAGEAFPLSYLEALHRAGELSDEQYDRLRRAALGLPDSSAKKGNCTLSRRADKDDEGN